jgi:hypothetical protein
MNTNLIAILAAVGIAVVASPAFASASRVHAAPSAARVSNAHGSAAGTTPVTEGNPFRIDDAVHVAFPQRDNGI